MKNIGIIGFGNMGAATAAGITAAEKKHEDKKKNYQLGAIETEPERARIAETQYGARLFNSYAELFDFSDITIIAIKPQDLPALLKAVGNAAAGKQIISIVAGTKLSYLTEGFQTHDIARFMPNLAAQIGSAVVGISYTSDASKELRRNAQIIVRAIGEGVEIPEKLMSAITGLSGSGIAYVFAFMHALALGGTSVGITYPESLQIAIHTVRGAADMLEHSLETETGGPTDLITRVCSPGGTTIQGIKVLEEEGFTAVVMDAVEAATRKAAQMEG